MEILTSGISQIARFNIIVKTSLDKTLLVLYIKSMNFGNIVKNTRLKRQETLHQLSMGTDIDVTLLSKFERNVRFPTNEQLERISKYLQIAELELKAIVISNKIVKEYGINDTTHKAIQLVSEQLVPYSFKSKKRTP